MCCLKKGFKKIFIFKIKKGNTKKIKLFISKNNCNFFGNRLNYIWLKKYFSEKLFF